MSVELLSPGYMTSSDVHLTREPYRKDFNPFHNLGFKYIGWEMVWSWEKPEYREGQGLWRKIILNRKVRHDELKSSQTCGGNWALFYHKAGEYTQTQPSPCVSSKKRSVWFKQTQTGPLRVIVLLRPQAYSYLTLLYVEWKWENCWKRKEIIPSCSGKRIDDPRGLGGQGQDRATMGAWVTFYLWQVKQGALE